VVAYFHYVVFGAVVFAMFGGFYFWWPKLTGAARGWAAPPWLTFAGFRSLPVQSG
jgi:cytochrome c oxidase subunit 1